MSEITDTDIIQGQNVVSYTCNTPCTEQRYCHPGTITSTLLDGIKDGHEDAWSRMTLLYGPLVLLWCRQAGLQLSDADDIVQEVLIAVAARIGEFERHRAEGSFRGWLRTIARNKIGDFIRLGQRRRRLCCSITQPVDLATAGSRREDLSADCMKDETRLVFNQILELIRRRFEEPTWRAFVRVVMDEALPRDVAEELGLSIESVYQAKSRVLRRVRHELRQLGE